MGTECGPHCRWWIFLSKSDAICDNVARRLPDGGRMGLLEGQFCEYGKHINDPTHNRECPRCGAIGEWIKGEPREKTTLGGVRIISTPMLGVRCVRCGTEFEPRVHEKLHAELNRVMREIKKH